MTIATIHPDDLTDPRVTALLQDHLDQLSGTAPPESRHALDVRGLQAANVKFYVAKINGDVAGCGAIKQIDRAHGEVKSMKTAPAFMRRGIAGQILEHLIEQARALGLNRLSLETGSMDFFKPAHNLYKKYGFVECPPFGSYKEDANSLFMTLKL